MRKIWIGAGIVVLLSLTIVSMAYGAQTLTLIIKGNRVQTDITPKIENGHTYAPLRVVADYLNEDIAWEPQTKTVTVHPDIWKQNIAQLRGSEDWIYNRNTVILFLTYFDEMNKEGRKLVSKDFQTNVIGSEVIIPINGNSRMIDYKFIDAKVDQQSKTMIIRVKIWWYYDPVGFQVKTWDFTLDLTQSSDEFNMRHLITKVWQVDAAKVESHTVFPGLTFEAIP